MSDKYTIRNEAVLLFVTFTVVWIAGPETVIWLVNPSHLPNANTKAKEIVILINS